MDSLPKKGLPTNIRGSILHVCGKSRHIQAGIFARGYLHTERFINNVDDAVGVVLV
jgi:hypothetical protein